MSTLDDHEARISALEAAQVDYRSVLAAVNALGVNQREHSIRMTSFESRMASFETRMTSFETRITRVEIRLDDFRQETTARFRSVDDQLAEIKDLIIGGRDR